MSHDRTHDISRDRVSVSEAARRLGISDGAVRKRVERGSLDGDKDEEGRLYVWLDGVVDASHDPSHDGRRTAPGGGTTGDPGQGQSPGAANEVYEARIADLKEQLAFFRSEMERRSDEAERKDRIIAGLAQANAELSSTVRELEAPAREHLGGEAEEPHQGQAQRPEDAATGAGEPAEGSSPGKPVGGPESGTFATASSASVKPQVGERTRKAPWWRRWFGRT